MAQLHIGLTGGIGSGKSTVAKIFQVLGIPIFDADSTAKNIMNENESLKKKLMDTFGNDTYQDGKLNRQYLASIVFSDPYKLELLNSLVHPATIQAAKDWMHLQTAPYTIKEAALLFESGTAGDLDFVIGVYTPKNIRMQRVAARDNAQYEDIQKRMHNQLNEEMKMKLCDFVILNDEKQLLTDQVLILHKKLLDLANK
ncbi:MAG: dephospho-CoA kinase [Pseudopedobacter saltans]|uniref:Dephospho-CoA kinase n=1 Tax=Pseudopedobacter saltans TaxID=151895 RepID=A0A2W5F736_9SPHI|nr:MAG: dephospho-CoA kinase [Pseudopedobacter saltans]